MPILSLTAKIERCKKRSNQRLWWIFRGHSNIGALEPIKSLISVWLLNTLRCNEELRINFEGQDSEEIEINRFYREEVNLQNGRILNFQEIEVESLWVKDSRIKGQSQRESRGVVWMQKEAITDLGALPMVAT